MGPQTIFLGGTYYTRGGARVYTSEGTDAGAG